MTNKTMLGVFALAAIAVLAVGSVAAFGFGGFMKGASDEERQEFHGQVKTAIENNDFAAWKTLMESQLTEENFNSMVEMHTQMQEMHDPREQIREAVENGDTETAQQLREQLQELMPEEAKPLGMAYMKGFRHGFNFAENNLD